VTVARVPAARRYPVHGQRQISKFQFSDSHLPNFPTLQSAIWQPAFGCGFCAACYTTGVMNAPISPSLEIIIPPRGCSGGRMIAGR
jgi:hypothetical protein